MSGGRKKADRLPRRRWTRAATVQQLPALANSCVAGPDSLSPQAAGDTAGAGRLYGEQPHARDRAGERSQAGWLPLRCAIIRRRRQRSVRNCGGSNVPLSPPARWPPARPLHKRCVLARRRRVGIRPPTARVPDRERSMGWAAATGTCAQPQPTLVISNNTLPLQTPPRTNGSNPAPLLPLHTQLVPPGCPRLPMPDCLTPPLSCAADRKSQGRAEEADSRRGRP